MYVSPSSTKPQAHTDAQRNTLKQYWQATKTLCGANLSLTWQTENSQFAFQRQWGLCAFVCVCLRVCVCADKKNPQQSLNAGSRATKLNAWTSWHEDSRTHTFTQTHSYMIRNGYACQDSLPSVPEGTEVLSAQGADLSLYKWEGRVWQKEREGWEVKTESNKACWSQKLQKLIGHTQAGLHLHPAIAFGPSYRKTRKTLTNFQQERHQWKYLGLIWGIIPVQP